MARDDALLEPQAVQRFLRDNPGWTLQGRELVKTYELPSFPEAISFVQRVANAAEQRNHHPDIDIRYRRVTLRLSTHSAGGLTFRDPDLAREADRLLTSPR